MKKRMETYIFIHFRLLAGLSAARLRQQLVGVGVLEFATTSGLTPDGLLDLRILRMLRGVRVAGNDPRVRRLRA